MNPEDERNTTYTLGNIDQFRFQIEPNFTVRDVERARQQINALAAQHWGERLRTRQEEIFAQYLNRPNTEAPQQELQADLIGELRRNMEHQQTVRDDMADAARWAYDVGVRAGQLAQEEQIEEQAVDNPNYFATEEEYTRYLEELDTDTPPLVVEAPNPELINITNAPEKGETTTMAINVEIRTANKFSDLQRQKIREIASDVLAPVVGKKIVIAHRGKTQKPIEDGCFHIHCWSSVRGRRVYTPPSELWIFTVQDRSKSYKPSGDGLALKAGRWSHSELVGNNLYIHHNIFADPNRPSTYDLELFKKILDAVTRAYTDTTPELDELAKTNYVNFCLKRKDDSIKQLEDRNAKARQALQSSVQASLQKIRLAKQSQFDLTQALNSKPADMRKKFEIEFERLLEHPKIVKVRVTSGKFMVDTETLYCTDPRSKKVHEIGKFCIEINPNTGSIRWDNLTRKVDGMRRNMNGPHIWADGQACMGNTSSSFHSLIANYELAIAAHLAIEFVESVNVNDGAGERINNWPLAPEKMQAKKGK